MLLIYDQISICYSNGFLQIILFEYLKMLHHFDIPKVSVHFKSRDKEQKHYLGCEKLRNRPLNDDFVLARGFRDVQKHLGCENLLIRPSGLV